MTRFLLLFLLKELLEELDLIADGVIPVIAVMTSRTGDEVMTHFLLEETFMYGLVYTEEEIVYATVYDDSQGTIFQTVELVDNGMVVPNFEVLVTFAQVFLHAPTVRERADVHATAGSTYSTEWHSTSHRVPPC